MSAKIIDGKKLSQTIMQNITNKIDTLKDKKERPPSLSVILVGENPASHIYVEHKKKACIKVGIQSNIHKLPNSVSEQILINLIQSLNADKKVDGILLQLPLPPKFNTLKIIEHILPTKDVDGLTSKNQGLLSLGIPQHIPCTPLGIMSMLNSINFTFKNKTACVIGRSILVGAPIAKLLTLNHVTVTQIHSKTLNPKAHTSQSDLIIAAAGQANLVNKDWIKKEAVVIDVGIHKIDGKLTGDTDYQTLLNKASYLTPVPGGVGPMTIASLLQNCLNAYSLHTN